MKGHRCSIGIRYSFFRSTTSAVVPDAPCTHHTTHAHIHPPNSFLAIGALNVQSIAFNEGADDGRAPAQQPSMDTGPGEDPDTQFYEKVGHRVGRDCSSGPCEPAALSKPSF